MAKLTQSAGMPFLCSYSKIAWRGDATFDCQQSGVDNNNRALGRHGGQLRSWEDVKFAIARTLTTYCQLATFGIIWTKERR